MVTPSSSPTFSWIKKIELNKTKCRANSTSQHMDITTKRHHQSVVLFTPTQRHKKVEKTVLTQMPLPSNFPLPVLRQGNNHTIRLLDQPLRVMRRARVGGNGNVCRGPINPTVLTVTRTPVRSWSNKEREKYNPR